jgi:microsomal prostaglandin-E synthase 2
MGLRYVSSTTPIKLYQYKICPFSNIAKVVLTYQQVPYQSIEVNPLTKAELKFSKSYRKVPIAQQGQRQWNGTEEILDHFAAVPSSSSSSFVGGDNSKSINNNNDNNDFATGSSSRQWQDFARNKLAPLLYPNLCDTLSNSFRAFDYVHQEPNFSTLQRYSIQYLGALAMYMAASKIKKKYHLTDVRASLHDALTELEGGLLMNSSSVSTTNNSTNNDVILPTDPNIFLNPNSTTEPHLGDLAVFGVLWGLEGLTILNDDILQNQQFPKIQQWYQDMNDQVERKQKIDIARGGIL